MNLFFDGIAPVRQTIPMTFPAQSIGILGVAGLATAALLACKSAPAAYPDAAKLASSEHSWCGALAKYEAPQDQSWRHIVACNAAIPTGSAPFVAQMAECYRKHHEDQGDDAMDLGGLVARCADVVLAAAEPVGFEVAAPVRARCARMERCAKVSQPTCLAAIEQLDPMQKVGLTSAYNLAAQHAIAECLEDSACSPDEDAVQAACYAAAQKLRVWLPLD